MEGFKEDSLKALEDNEPMEQLYAYLVFSDVYFLPIPTRAVDVVTLGSDESENNLAIKNIWEVMVKQPISRWGYKQWNTYYFLTSPTRRMCVMLELLPLTESGPRDRIQFKALPIALIRGRPLQRLDPTAPARDESDYYNYIIHMTQNTLKALVKNRMLLHFPLVRHDITLRIPGKEREIIKNVPLEDTSAIDSVWLGVDLPVVSEALARGWDNVRDPAHASTSSGGGRSKRRPRRRRSRPSRL